MLENLKAYTHISRRLTGIEVQLTRIADLLELHSQHDGVIPRQTNTEGDPPDFSYVDEERDLAREIADLEGRKVAD